MKSLFFIFLIIYFFSGCSVKTFEFATITIKGSDSMLRLTENLAEEYMKENPGISIYVNGGGTSEGIKALIRGEVDICTASRNLEPGEAKSLAEYYGTVGLFHLIAKDALSIYVNKNNTIGNLSLEQLKDIFKCKITNWKTLGSKESNIITVTRNPNSGSFLYFKEHVLEGSDYCPDAVTEATTNDVIDFIEQNENAIGYGSMGFTGDIIHVSINGIEPSEKNAQNDSYPITRYLHFFTSRTPKGAIKNFIDWVLSPVGQKVIKQSGFIPLWEVTY
jgi:phosphate transport system substrate-binding protein